MSHKPTVTDFKVRPATYPEGHWMNRFWGSVFIRSYRGGNYYYGGYCWNRASHR